MCVLMSVCSEDFEKANYKLLSNNSTVGNVEKIIILILSSCLPY